MKKHYVIYFSRAGGEASGTGCTRTDPAGHVINVHYSCCWEKSCFLAEQLTSDCLSHTRQPR